MAAQTRLAFHVCCAPCMILPTRAMIERFDEVALIYYNPNIAPLEEYELRRQYVIEQAQALGVKAHEFSYDHELWEQRVDTGAAAPDRCQDCYRLRLECVGDWAAENGFTHLATTLTISPYQDEDGIHTIGREIGESRGLSFVNESFSGMYYESRRVAADLDLYRQNYCGCLPSKAEAEATRRARKAERKAAKEARTAETRVAQTENGAKA